MEPILPSKPPTLRHPAEMLFTLRGLGAAAAETIRRWHYSRQKHAPTFDLFFSLGRSQLFQEHQFLVLVQAIEAYHRRAFPSHATDPATHDIRVERIVRAVANSEGLSLTAILGPRPKFARTITQTGNYVTHWSEEAKPEAVRGSDLVRPVYQLRLVTKLIFLGELGLATDQMAKNLPEFRTLQIL